MRAAKMRELNRLREHKLERAYKEAPVEASKELKKLKGDPLFVAGVTLYAARGDRKGKGPITLTSAEPELIRVFGAFLMEVCGIPEGKLRMHLILNSSQDEWLSKIHWARESGLPARNFTKTTRVKGSKGGEEAGFGFSILTVSNAYLKLKLLTWITELPKQLIDRR